MDVTTFAVNQFIPHPMMLFAAGTYSENESPHLALVSWVNFYWDDGLGVVLCMDGDKTVKRNFEREGVMVLNALSRLSVALQEGKRTRLSPALPWSLPNTCTLLNYARVPCATKSACGRTFPSRVAISTYAL